MRILENHDLTTLNTLRVKAEARFFVEIKDEAELKDLFSLPEFKNNKKFFLGGGSNILFTKDWGGIVVKVSILGNKIVEENDDSVLLEAGAGENWHELVTYAVENNWGGIENLALIPGLAGAAPIQNIAAYGENFSDVFDSLDAWNVETGEVRTFNKSECEFAYRSSVFKKELKGKYIILRIRIRLSKNPKIEDSYYQMGITRESIKEELAKTAQPPYKISDVYNVVVDIRKRKLPDPEITPTVGSFFLNSIVSKEKFEELASKVSDLHAYPPDQMSNKEPLGSVIKVASGRLLQALGWLGKWEGNVGVHDRHALVIVTNGKATGEEVINFAAKVQKSYLENYGIKLETEVNLI